MGTLDLTPGESWKVTERFRKEIPWSFSGRVTLEKVVGVITEIIGRKPNVIRRIDPQAQQPPSPMPEHHPLIIKAVHADMP